ncbi:RNA polymerase sigma factor [Crenothrix sp.]|uniref:RNA polymerase sigma factor n=1 Tax=Crenothrix sp. TaxID=3100433 RepID=UPI00374CB5BE
MNDKIGRENNQNMDIESVESSASQLLDAELQRMDDSIADDLATGAMRDEKQLLGDLLDKIIDQDQLAFATLYKIMMARVYSLALRITRCAQTAEEVMEDTFWQVWRQAPRFDPARGNAITWIMTIARSRALDALRHKDNPVADNQEMIDSVPSSTDNPLNLLEAVQENSSLHTALAALDPTTQQVIALAFFQGLTHEEVAHYSGLQLGTVKSMIRRALIHLKQVLGDGNLS